MDYPLTLRFRLLALASQISVRGPGDRLVCYVRQKMFKLKEAVTVFGDEEQRRVVATIAADRWLDFSARYRVTDAHGREIGVLQRRGMRSFWRASYEVERDGRLLFTIGEANPWVKLVDGAIGEIPVVGMLTGYFLHPAYRVVQAGSGVEAFRVTKQPALFEGRFELDRRTAVGEEEEHLVLYAVLMMLLLERARG